MSWRWLPVWRLRAWCAKPKHNQESENQRPHHNSGTSYFICYWQRQV
jgi:hypothetical protein